MKSMRCGNLVVIGCAFVFAVSAATDARGTALLGVQWDSSLTVSGNTSAKTKQGLTAMLAQPWRLEDYVVIFEVKNAGGDHAAVNSCGALFKADSNGMQPTEYGDPKVYRAWASGCYAVRAVSQASAAKKSFVGNFSLNVSSVKKLPVGIAFVISNDEVRKLEAIQASGGSLGVYLGKATITLEKGSPARGVSIDDGSGGSQVIRWIASGDFDHDGVEDLLISTYCTVSGGDYAASGLYLVSRHGPQAQFTLMKVYPVMGPGVSNDAADNFRMDQH